MTIETHNTNAKATKPRRWFRFRLRTLLVMVTLLSVPLGWVGWELDQRRKEKVAIAWVEEMGGAVDLFRGRENGWWGKKPERSWWEEKKDSWFGERVWGVELQGEHVTDLMPLAELKKLHQLVLWDSSVTDLTPLAKLKSLRGFGLYEAQVSDLSPLAGLRFLKGLELSSTPVSDLSPLAELKNLTSLDLSNTQVRNLSPLTELTNLKSLWLVGTPVNDLSLLVELKNLEEFVHSWESDEQLQQVKELELALPNCSIGWSPAGE